MVTGGSTIEHRLNLPERYRYERVLDVFNLKAGDRRVIATLEGPGCIRHFDCLPGFGGNRDFILRAYWEGEESPSVEVPVADFWVFITMCVTIP